MFWILLCIYIYNVYGYICFRSDFILAYTIWKRCTALSSLVFLIWAHGEIMVFSKPAWVYPTKHITWISEKAPRSHWALRHLEIIKWQVLSQVWSDRKASWIGLMPTRGEGTREELSSVTFLSALLAEGNLGFPEEGNSSEVMPGCSKILPLPVFSIWQE